MRIVGAQWTPSVNLLLILCDCGRSFHHRADGWFVRCPGGHEDNLHQIRERYVVEQQAQQFEYRLPKVTISVEITSKERDEVRTAQYDLDPRELPRNVMDDIEKLVGNAQARVTVSADFGIKDYGTGASAMASVSLTCNQDQQTIERAARIAGDLARDIAQEQRARAEGELQALIDQRTAPPGSSAGYGR